MLVNADK